MEKVEAIILVYWFHLNVRFSKWRCLHLWPLCCLTRKNHFASSISLSLEMFFLLWARKYDVFEGQATSVEFHSDVVFLDAMSPNEMNWSFHRLKTSNQLACGSSVESLRCGMNSPCVDDFFSHRNAFPRCRTVASKTSLSNQVEIFSTDVWLLHCQEPLVLCYNCKYEQEVTAAFPLTNVPPKSLYSQEFACWKSSSCVCNVQSLSLHVILQSPYKS